ncbi:hypothetical protein VNI00_007024 [Paramarasmius palmivorus]|uniref:Uncharacterized protein n=1 Tax=Paramarasmius palmivorus TaxID=297713 RepID=A0AAW0D428_9AGAR
MEIQALHRDHIGQKAWQIALNALPKDNLTASDIATKEACERGYAKSKKRGEDVAAQVKRERNSTEEYPLWRRVQALSDARPTGLILKANSSFCQAKLACDSYRKVTELLEDMMHRYNFASDNYLLPNGSPITALVRVILHDPRFLFTWDDTWLSKVLHFAEHENTGAGGWMDSNFDEQFRDSVMEQLRQKGWNFTRIPLVITVQCWIIRGIMIEGPGIKRVEHLYKALQVVRWARTTLMPEEFAKLENSDRYNELELLSPAFLLAVQKTYLDSIIECMEPNIVADDKKPHLLEEIRSEAEELLLKVSSMPRDDEALYAVAYQDFPRGIAHAALGTYYCERAYLATPPLPQAEFEELMKKSSEQFRQAVLWFPEGDEYRARYLHLALEGMIAGGDTLLGALMEPSDS